MAKYAYTLKKKKETDELHLFKGEFTSTTECNSKQLSICGGMNKADSAGNSFACKDENEARTRCAEIGRSVCGNCIRDLYTTYK